MIEEVQDHRKEFPYKVALYRALVTCANEVLRIGLDPEFLQDLQFTVASNICLGDLNSTLEELQREIEKEAHGDRLRAWEGTLATLNIQRLDLIDESEQLIGDMEEWYGPESNMVGRIAWFYSLYILARAALGSIQEVQHDFLNGEPDTADIADTRGVIAHLASYSCGSEDAIDQYDDPEYATNLDIEGIRADTKESAVRVSQILDTIQG